jgi:hypothetical protein
LLVPASVLAITLFVVLLLHGRPLTQAPKSVMTDVLPGGRPQDAHLALNQPDEFAWQLFFTLCRQAAPGKAGLPDSDKPTFKDYDPDRPVVWETWALCNGGRIGAVYVRPNRSEVYRDRGARPPAWDELPRREPPPKVLEPFPGKGVEFLFNAGRPPGKFDPVEDGGEGGVEVRMNRATYDYIREQGLYSIEGLEEKFRAKAVINFPLAAQEIKARWVRLSERDKPRYHWRTVKAADGKEQLWGLSGLHVSTRDLPNWFWCDFEHVDYEKNAEQYSRDATTRGENPPAGRDGIRRETVGTKWEHYRLRGTQIDFTDSLGRPVILANSQIEHGFQQTSSCMTCHALASVGLRARDPDLPAWQPNVPPSFLTISPVLSGPLGVPKPSWFLDDFGRPRYVQTHFVFSAPLRALSTKVDPP